MNPRRARILVAAITLAAITLAGLSLAGVGIALPGSAAPTVPAAPVRDRAVPTTDLDPARIPRGEDPAVPVLLDRTILDVGVEITVDADEVHLLGRSGRAYVVVTYTGSRARIERVSRTGQRRTVVERLRGEAFLSSDGNRVVESLTKIRPTRTVVLVRDSRTGDRRARRVVPGAATVLDALQQRVLIGVLSPPKTVWWNTATDGVRKISARSGYAARVRANRLAVLTGDPYAGGCSVLSPLSAPRTVLWRTCDDAILAISPDGRRLVTTSLLADGPLGQVRVHGDHGRLRHQYRSRGYLGDIAFESSGSLLLATYGPHKAAIVRCTPFKCERASDLIDTP